MDTGISYDFSGKVVFITGGGAGIGRSTAVAFASAGAWVAVADSDEDNGLNTVRMIQENGGEAIFFKFDAGNVASTEHTIHSVVRHTGRIDCAFNNAGMFGESSNIAECTVENWHKVIDVNLRGVWLCMKHEIHSMLKMGGGSIVNCATIAGLVGFADSSAYVAAKHGVLGLTKAGALEYAKSNIRINAICPGFIQSSTTERSTANFSLEPMGRLGTPDEVASAVLWLCSSQATFVTGHALVIDGGYVIT